MGKSHRDNHAARKKRGNGAFEKKAKRRAPESKCSICGNKCRPKKLTNGVCPVCLSR